jgi:aryl-alcohol dehydrogenase-like predicted oxidoreductase
VDTLAPDDFRRRHPRFEPENFSRNLPLAAALEAMAREKGCTAAQLALAWVMGQGPDVVAIPGTKRRTYLEENVAALEVSLGPEDLRRLAVTFPLGVAAGPRYPEAAMRSVNG